MTLRTLAADALSVMAPLVLAVIGLAVTRLTELVRNRVRDSRVQKLLQIVADLTGAAVAEAYQTIVKGLKAEDSKSKNNSPWTLAARDAVKARVVQAVREQAPGVLSELTRNGLTNPDALLSALVERSVLELNATLARTDADRASIRPPMFPRDDVKIPGTAALPREARGTPETLPATPTAKGITR